MNFFRCPTELCFGSDALARLQDVQAARVLIVTDGYFLQNGLAEQIGRRIAGATLSFFSEVKPDPGLQTVARGVAQMQAAQPDVLLALGGGSVLDCAKAILAFSDCAAYFIAVPTTSGTGSEVTSFSILSHNGVKHVVTDEKLLPQLAILDESLLGALPPKLIAEAGMDAIAHCAEAICARQASPFSDCLAKGAFSVLLAALPRSFARDKSVRGDVHLAACMAGLSFTHAGLGLCHALAHALGGRFPVAHGQLCAILLPQVIAYNAASASDAYAALADAAGISGSTAILRTKNLRTQLMKLRRQLRLADTLAQAGISRAALQSAQDGLVEAALQDPCLQQNPRAVDASALRALLWEVAQ